MARIHLIGRNGYIGALLINYLSAVGHTVEVASYRLPNITPKSIDADIVIHLAAYGGGSKHKPRNGWDDYEQMRDINVNGMKALLLGLVNKYTKIIFLSSSAVYGKFINPSTLCEESVLKPDSEYGRQKVEAENILRDSDFEWNILRICSIFGPSINNNFGNSFHNTVIKNAIKTGEITIMGGDQKIDTLYILDLISIILRSCADEWHAKEIFNISGEITTVENMLNIVADSIQHIGMLCSVSKEDYSKVPSALMDIKKLQRSFPGWKTTSLQCSIHSLVAAHLQKYNSL